MCFLSQSSWVANVRFAYCLCFSLSLCSVFSVWFVFISCVVFRKCYASSQHRVCRVEVCLFADICVCACVCMCVVASVSFLFGETLQPFFSLYFRLFGFSVLQIVCVCNFVNLLFTGLVDMGSLSEI